tara:strand:+ start:1091 stop:1714 length:624 start_codon:yes stop_codon:yes gene_type:complete
MSTFSQLQTDIKNYMEDDGTEFSTSLTQFISNTELKLSRDLSTPEFKRKVTSAFTANDPFLTMPTDLVTLEHLQVIDSNVRTMLQLKSDEYITEFWPNRTSTGVPRYYTYFDTSTIYVAPTPSSNLSLELSYKRRLPALSSSNTSNFLTTDAYDALLYGCLIEASLFNRNDKLVQYYTELYKKAVADVNREQNQKLSMDNFYMKTEG